MCICCLLLWRAQLLTSRHNCNTYLLKFLGISCHYLQKYFCDYCIHTSVWVSRYIRRDLLKKDKSKRPHRRMHSSKCMHTSNECILQKNSQMQWLNSQIWREAFSMWLEKQSHSEGLPCRKLRIKLIGLPQVGDTLILKKSQSSTQIHI